MSDDDDDDDNDNGETNILNNRLFAGLSSKWCPSVFLSLASKNYVSKNVISKYAKSLCGKLRCDRWNRYYSENEILTKRGYLNFQAIEQYLNDSGWNMHYVNQNTLKII